MQPDVSGPDGLFLLCLVSRYAKDRAYGHGDRAALYRIKALGLRALCRSGRLIATELHPGPWLLAERLRAGPLDDWLASALSAAEMTGEALGRAELTRQGLSPHNLLITGASEHSRWETLSPSQRSQLHPKGTWLISFAEPGDTHAVLHQPHWQVADWLSVPPPASTRQGVGHYGAPPGDGERRQWPLETVLQRLGVPVRAHTFPGLLRRRLVYPSA